MNAKFAGKDKFLAHTAFAAMAANAVVVGAACERSGIPHADLVNMRGP